MMTSSTHTSSSSRRWPSGAKKSTGESNVMSKVLPWLGWVYTVLSVSNRAFFCPWKYRNFQCAKHVSQGRLPVIVLDLPKEESNRAWETNLIKKRTINHRYCDSLIAAVWYTIQTSDSEPRGQ